MIEAMAWGMPAVGPQRRRVAGPVRRARTVRGRS